MMSIDNEHELRQRLLEMIHGLLSDEEAAELRERVCSDPEVARAYSEVSFEAGVMAKEARLEGAKMDLLKERERSGGYARYYSITIIPNLSRATARIIYTALLLLLAASLGGYLWLRSL